MLGKRFFLRKVFLILVILLTGLMLYAFWWEPSSLLIKHYDITLNQTDPPEWRGLKIAIISDLHAGSPYIDAAKIKKIVNETNNAHPDIILLLGDFMIQGVIGGKHMPAAEIAGYLKNLQVPLGVYAVLGNHDWWDNSQTVLNGFINSGIPVLEDRSVHLTNANHNLWITGITDFYEGPHNILAALSIVPKTRKTLCLTHTPDIFPILPNRCFLTIAGHTHGGQVKLPILGRLVVPSKYGPKYAAGYVFEGDKHLFISTGIGTSILPVRFGVPPEISILYLN